MVVLLLKLAHSCCCYPNRQLQPWCYCYPNRQWQSWCYCYPNRQLQPWWYFHPNRQWQPWCYCYPNKQLRLGALVISTDNSLVGAIVGSNEICTLRVLFIQSGKFILGDIVIKCWQLRHQLQTFASLLQYSSQRQVQTWCYCYLNRFNVSTTDHCSLDAIVIPKKQLQQRCCCYLNRQLQPLLYSKRCLFY